MILGAFKEIFWILWSMTILSIGFFILGFYNGTSPSSVLHVLFGLMFLPCSGYFGYATYKKKPTINKDEEAIISDSTTEV